MYSTCMCGVFLAKHTQRRSALSIWLTRLSHFSWLQPLGQWYLAGESKSCVSHVFKERGENLPDTTERICPSQDTRFCVKEVASRFLNLFIFPPKQSCFGSIVYVLLIFNEGDYTRQPTPFCYLQEASYSKFSGFKLVARLSPKVVKPFLSSLWLWLLLTRQDKSGIHLRTSQNVKLLHHRAHKLMFCGSWFPNPPLHAV